MARFKKVANRGEIAVRIIRAREELGIPTLGHLSWRHLPPASEAGYPRNQVFLEINGQVEEFLIKLKRE